MSILSGFKKYKNYKANANGDHQLQSFWTSTDTVEDANGNTLTSILANLPNPMVMRGTVGAQEDNPTVTALPVDGSATIGDTYKVITDGTYASVVAKIGDFFTCITKTSSANTWSHIPAGDDSIVIANPQGTATGNLETVSIDGTIYSVKDGNAMIKGVDYVTAGRKSGTTAGEKTTAEGYETTASYAYAHAEGQSSVSSGQASHAEGYGGTASGNYSHVEGESNTASGRCAHAEGNNTSASSNYTHTEGRNTTASDQYAHAEGFGTIASSETAHAENCYTTASGFASHAEGLYTIARQPHQHVQGKYNIEDENNRYAHIVGGGTSDSDRKNIHTLDWYGNAKFAGEVEDGNGNKLSDPKGSQTVTGNPLTLTDAAPIYAEELSVDLEPIQDLHGYDKPWVGGAGKNLLPFGFSDPITTSGITFTPIFDDDGNKIAIRVNGTSTAKVIQTIGLANVETGTSVIVNGCPSGGSANKYYVTIYGMSQGASDFGSGSSAFSIGNTKNVYIIVENGQTISDLVFKPMVRLATETDATFEPYENISPIQGYDIVSVDRCGKNLFDGALKQGASSEYVINTNKLKVKPNTTYYWVEFNWSNSGSRQAFFYTENNTLISYQDVTGNNFTTPANCALLTIQHYKNGGLSVPTNPQIVVSESLPTQFEPYNGQTVSLQLGNKNLLALSDESVTVNDVTITPIYDADGNIIKKRFQGTASATINRSIGRLICKPNTTIKFVTEALPTGVQRYFLWDNTLSTNVKDNISNGTTYTVSNDHAYVLGVTINSGSSVNADIQIMAMDANIVDETFSPYNPTLGGMVYGGQLTLNDDGSAVFVGDKASVDLGSLTYTLSQSYSGVFYATMPTYKMNGNMFSSCYEFLGGTNEGTTSMANVSTGTFKVSNYSGNYQIYIKDTRYSDATSFKTAVTGQQIVYELATPFTIHLSAEQLKLLQGTNNVWSNAGDVTLKYQPDNVIAEPKADVQRLRDDVDDRLVGNASKNLFNKSGKQTTTYGAATISGETITVTGTYYCQIDMPLPADIYTVSATVKSFGATHGFRLMYEDNSLSSMADSMTIDTNGKNVKAILLYCGTGTSATTVYERIQVERNDHQTAYEEYYPSNRELWEMIKALQNGQ